MSTATLQSPSYTVSRWTIAVTSASGGPARIVTMETTPLGTTGRAIACTCPDFTYRKARTGGSCTHMSAAETGQGSKPRVTLALRPVYDAAAARQKARLDDMYA